MIFLTSFNLIFNSFSFFFFLIFLFFFSFSFSKFKFLMMFGEIDFWKDEFVEMFIKNENFNI